MTRQSFVVRAAAGAGAIYGAGPVAAVAGRAVAQYSDADLAILNFLLTLERVQSAFYERALERVRGLSSEATELVQTLGENEQEHVEAVTATIEELGGSPRKPPKLSFEAFDSADLFLAAAQRLEDLTVGAYNGAAPSLKSDDVLALAGAIVQVEGRHAAAVRDLRGEPVAPGPYDEGDDRAEVLAVLKAVLRG